MNARRAFKNQFSEILSFSRPAKLFLLVVIADGIVYSGWNLFFNFYILERGFSRDFLGLLNAVPSLGTLLFGIPMGLLSDRIGRKRALLLGFLLNVSLMGVEVSFTNPFIMLLAALFSGAFSALYFLSQAPLMMKVSDDSNRTLLFSLSFGLATISGAIGNAFAGQLPGWFGAWLRVSADSAAAYQAVLLSSIALSFITLVPLALLREPSGRVEGAHTDEKRPSVWQVISKPVTLKLALPNFLIGLGASILIPYVNLFFADRFGMSDGLLGMLFSLSALLTGIGSFIGPRLAGNLGSKVRAVVVTQGGSLVFLALMGFVPHMAFASFAYLLRGALMNMAVPLLDAYAMEQVAEKEQGTLNSVRSLAWQVGWVVGPYASGLVQEMYGFTPLFITTGLLYAAATLFTWLFFEKKAARQKEEIMEDVLEMEADIVVG